MSNAFSDQIYSLMFKPNQPIKKPAKPEPEAYKFQPPVEFVVHLETGESKIRYLVKAVSQTAFTWGVGDSPDDALAEAELAVANGDVLIKSADTCSPIN